MRTSSSLIKTTINSLMLTALILQSFSGLTNLTYASAPFIQTRISVASDGFVPFDATTFALPNISAGTDADATNGVVRVTDTMRYKIEVAVNDSANAGNLISTVRLDPSNTIAPLPRQKWKAIPDTCIASGSSISSDGQTLVCNLGTYREGTNAIYYAEARVTQHNRNGNHIVASTTATAAGANTATSGPTDTITTAGFGVDLVKTLKPPYKNTSGDIIYTPDANVDLLGNPGGTGYMVTYRISADYNPGSAFASGDASNLVSYVLSDTFQYFSGYLGTGAVFAGCSDVSDNIGSIGCPTVGTQLFASGGTSTTFPITLNNIDIHQPVDGNKIFAIDVRYWIPLTDIRTDGVPLTNRNDVIFNGGSIVGANNQPLGADGQINSSEGLSNNGMDYPLFRIGGGISASVSKNFRGRGSTKNGKKKVFPGEIITNRIEIYLNNFMDDEVLIGCDNLDTSKIEFYEFINKPWFDPTDFNNTLWAGNPVISFYNYSTSTSTRLNRYKKDDISIFDTSYYIEYSNMPHNINTNSISAQRDSDCRDDLDGNGSYDWMLNPNDLIGGKSSVSKIRVTLKPDVQKFKKVYESSKFNLSMYFDFKLKVKDNVSSGSIVPNYLGLQYNSGARYNPTSVSDSILDPGYSLNFTYADRVTVVGAKASIQKTFNSLSNIATPGDTLSFTITPQVGGAYIPANGTIPSITVTDQLPASNTLVSWTGNCPAGQSVTLASPSTNPLVWTISGAAVGQPTCTIDYTVKLAETAGKGDYINTARIDVCDPALANDCGVLDKEVDSAGDDTIPIRAVAGYSVVAKGVNFDVLKTSPDLIRPIDSSFIFNLSYANLGIEDFSAGSGLDILPYNGDSYMTGTSGPNTSRSPGTNYHGSYKITTLTAANGEYDWQYTTADPTTLINEASNPNTSATWTSFNPASVASLSGVTAIRWSFPAGAVSAGALRKTIAMTITPSGNWSGDIYTNSFTAKVPEMSFPVISNDVSVQVVAGQIGDTVWIDDNSDGIINSGEQLLPNIPVTLYASNGTTVIATGVTDSNGQYLFTGLVAGSYHVQITPPAGLTPTYDLDSGTGNLATLDNRTLVTLTENRDFVTNALGGINSIDTADFGLYSTLGSIAGHIYHDTNANSGYETSDIYLGGITVNLLSGGVVIATGTTNASGAYLFPAVVPGTYDVSYVTPVGYQSHHAEIFNIQMCQPTVCNLPVDPDTGEPLGSCGPDICTSSPVPGTSITNITTINIILGSQQHSVNNDFGLVTPSSINGTVWYDMDANQGINNSEIYASGAKLIVTYTNPIQGTVTTTVFTDAMGNWSVTGIWTGSSYTVDLDMSHGPANGHRLTTNNVSSSGTVGYTQSLHVTDQGLYRTNVMITKTVDVSTATLGDVINYTINYANDSSGTAYNVSVYDLFPFQFLSINNSTPNFNSPSSTVGLDSPTTLTYSIGTLQPGQTGSITIAATVTTGTDAQIIDNLAAIDTAGTGYVTGTTITVTTGSIITTTGGVIGTTGSTTVETNTGDNTSHALVMIYRIDLNIVKDVDRSTVGPNDIFEYTLNIGNSSGTVSNIMVVDTLDANLVYVGMSTGTITATPSVSGQNITWSGITLSPHTTNTIKILVKPAQYIADGTILHNDVQIGRINNLGTLIPLYETDATNNISSAVVTLSGTNYASIAGHVYFDEDSSSGFDNNDTYQGGVTVSLLSGGTVIATGSTDSNGYYYFGRLVAGSYDVSYNLPSGYTAYTSLGGQGASSNGQGNLNSATETASTIRSIVLINQNHSINNDFGYVRPYDLVITKSSDMGTGTSDTIVTYLLHYANVGGYPVDDVVVTDVWPSDLIDFTTSSIVASSSTPHASGTSYLWNIGTMSPYNSGTIIITGTIKQGLASGTMVNNYAVIGSTSATTETNTLNNNSQNNHIVADTDLVITKSTSSSTSIIGTLVTWVIDYVNDGPQTAYDVTVHDLIPDGLSYESSSTSPNTQVDTNGGEHLTWDIGSLLAGQAGQIAVVTRTDTGVTHLAPYINTAVISGSTTERSLTNNVAMAQITAINKLAYDGYVWYDSDNSSSTGNQYGYTEAATSGIVVEIYNMSGVLIDTLTTDGSGYYYGLSLPGAYYTKIIIPTHYTLTTTNNTSFTIDVDDVNGVHVDDDGLYHKPGSFTATVWYDDDKSQSKNNTEAPVRGTQVMVYDSSNTLVGTYTTDANGAISGSLIPGIYTFRLNDIVSYTTTTQQSIQFTILSETDHHVYDFGTVASSNTTPSVGSSSPAPVSTPTPVATPVVKASTPKPTPTPIVEPVHEVAPTPVVKTPQPVIKKAWDTREVENKKSTIALDTIKVEQLHEAPDLSPRTFVLPIKLLDTGTPVSELKSKGISVAPSGVIDTTMPEWIQPVAPELAARMTLDDWIARIPANIMNTLDQEAIQQRIVIPSLGVVVPVDTIPEGNADWTSLVNGGEIGINDYLKKGVVHYPLSKQAGEIGNMIIAGHSSYYAKDDGLFKTIFASLPLLNAGDKVIVYQRQDKNKEDGQDVNLSELSEDSEQDAQTSAWDAFDTDSSTLDQSSNFSKFSYTVNNSYQITPYDTWILNSRPTTSHLTLFTCTPIGSNKNRWYIDATLEK